MGRYCPCGAVLLRASSVRRLGSPLFRMSMSIRVLDALPAKTKVCNKCRQSYAYWKRCNLEFESFFDRFEKDLAGDAEDDQVEDMDISFDSLPTNKPDKGSQTVAEHYEQYDKGSQTVAEIFEPPCITLPMNCTISSHTICYVCRSHIDGSSMTIAAEDRDMIFLTKNVMIREGSRCCRKHLEDHRLTPASINIIKPHKIEIISLKAGDVQMLINKSQILYNQKKRLDFDDCNAISDDEYYNLTSLNKGQFDSLIKEIAAFPIRNTAVRSIRTAVACLLCKLRLALSNTILALLFELPEEPEQ
ncbi:unnamed protein product [Didymodactylos carnosus]|uniref:Uncharacterized protein n=1 Tax=Didymodactylos carnosus TaxID=1234261 RepID=A0A8S2PIH1_9BILA|nr:unnamed protein product [Didymodactylos carnosus]CAF4057228.1 unnamed protein product [Didymodactylos carnosus]